MPGGPDDPALIALGAAVSDGAPVDWGRVEGELAAPEQQELVRGLRDVAALVNAHRRVDSLIAAETPADAPRTWRHLVLFEPLGDGAFGVVYRGWDPRVEREVAVKLLRRDAHPSHAPLAEARHLARVRHANVVVVHGADEDDAQAGIWMEFIDGVTLATMVRDHGVMSAREVIGIGLDLCRALSALHAAGLLHRDIKAQNVMREVGGRIVLMDFSGAQALVPGQDTEVFSGTPLYMAPELFDGGAATPASDVYSLGVLLFFLLTGTVPVDGPTMAALRQAHQRGARKRLRDLRADVPDAIVQIIERATAPAPASRLQTAGALEHALTGASGLAAAPAPSGAAARVGAARWRSAAVAAAVLIAAMIATGLIVRRLTPDPTLQTIRFSIGPPYITGSWPRLSPDGRQIVFGTMVENRNRFWIRPLEAREGRLLMNTEATETPFWSPDSRTLAFFSAGKLRLIPAAGGEPTAVTDAAEPRGADWSGDRIIFAASKAIFVVAPDGEQLRRVTTLDEAQGDLQHAWPRFLPDGRRFLFLIRSTRAERSGLYVGSLDGAAPIRLMDAYSRVTYSSGYLFWVREGALTAQPFDADRALPSGSPIVLAGRVKSHLKGDAAFDVVPSGILVYYREAGEVSTRLQLVDRRGRPGQTLTDAGAYRQPRFSPDGGRVVAEKADLAGGNSDLWVYDLARQSASRLTGADASDVHPLWSADGRAILFSSRRAAAYRMFIKRIDDAKAEQPFYPQFGEAIAEHWSRDGRYVAATVPRKGLWVFPLTTGQKPWAVRTDPRPNFWQAEFSPDGRFLAYMSKELGPPEVYVEPIPWTGDRWQVSTQGGGEPHWRDDGKELFYLAADTRLMSIDTTLPDWQISRPTPLFKAAVPDVDGLSDYGVGPEGQSFVLNVFLSDPVAQPLDVVVNWFSMLKK